MFCLKTEKGEYKQCALGRRNQEGFSFFWLSLDNEEVITFHHHRKRQILDKASCQLAAEQEDRSGVTHLLGTEGEKVSVFPFLGVFASTCVALCHKNRHCSLEKYLTVPHIAVPGCSSQQWKCIDWAMNLKATPGNSHSNHGKPRALKILQEI